MNRRAYLTRPVDSVVWFADSRAWLAIVALVALWQLWGGWA